MVYLKVANKADVEKEWDFVRKMPADENGLTNQWPDVSLEDFKTKALPEMIQHSRGENLPDWMVPETFFFLWDNDKIVGQFRLRHYLNDALRTGGGHIGQFIAKEYRNRGYCTLGLNLTLHYARNIVLEPEFYLRLHKDNIASLKAMLNNGGKVVNEDEKQLYVRISNPGKYADLGFKIETPNLILRDMTDFDLPTLKRWNTVETDWMENWDSPWLYENFLREDFLNKWNNELEGLQSFISMISKKKPEDRRYNFQIDLKESGQHIGQISCYGINKDYIYDDDGENFAFGIDLPESAYRGKGYGLQAFSAAVKYLKDSGLSDIYTQTWSGNSAMVKLAEKTGFKLVDVKKDARTFKGKKYAALTFKM